MELKPFVIYKSSAGSGKTYTLTLEYLKLALQFPAAFRSILAVTFTNKATQEMKERILEVLNRLRKDVNPNEFMDQELMKHLSLNDGQLKERAGQVLTAILHDYGQFSVSTIDSFFQKVVRAFAREIDLQAKFDIALDQGEVLERVVDRVVENVLEDKYLHKWLVDYAISQIQLGKSWDIRKNILSLGNQIFREDFKKFQGFIRDFLSDQENINGFQEYLRKKEYLLLGHIKEVKKQAQEIRDQYGLEWIDFSGGKNSFANKFEKLGQKDNPVPELTEKQKSNIEDETKWYSQKSKNKEAIISAYHAGLGQLLGQFEPLLYEWNTLEAIQKNFYAYGLFRNLLEELRELKDEENLLMISDANDFLKEITKENDAPFIYEKVGNQYKHFLIDEFQDTSGFQWDSFKPLLENSLAEGNTNLLVGDVKQSIYRWRGGDLKLLLEKVEEDINKDLIKVNNLDTNFRSLPAIIAFNNALFHHLPQQLQLSLQQENGIEDTGILEKAYGDVTQKVSSKKTASPFQGKVKLEFISKKEEEGEELSSKEQALEKIPQMVEHLQESGYQARDIAFLVRRKEEGAMIADTLMAYRMENPDLPFNYEVVSDESMYLTKAASVRALVAALESILNPEDKLPFQTLWYYWSMLHGRPISHEIFDSSQAPEWLEAKINSFLERRAFMERQPLMELMETLIAHLGLHELPMEQAYISGFRESVFDYVANNRADLAGFLQWWEDNHQKRTVKIPETHDAMPIMTIHKSKGLQFKVVLMPFLSWDIVDFKKENIIWSPFQDQDTGTEAIIPLTLRRNMAQSAFAPLYREEVTMAYLDTLNMVYVALTRAEEVFWGLCPHNPPKSGFSLKPLENNLFQLMIPISNEGNEYNAVFDQESKVFDWGELPKREQVSPVKQGVGKRWKYRDWSELLQVKPYAVDFSPEGLAQREKRDFGVLIHEVLEKSRQLKDIERHLQAFYFDGRLSAEEMDLVKEQLKPLMDDPVFAAWFDGKGDILTEQGVILPGGRQKRPDRIILKDDEALVVDFKTGEEKQAYHNQVKEYMELVGNLAKKPVKGYLCYLESGKILAIK
ncbi:UvrD-helicase domain-containing protein [Echinicola jeungdonensis]|uniref:DNA 3'-5' helicase n=1 Tax=Echinicola jeungdonensis TaxID=709343 RepID=A0ABV5J625_9BACT|nr:UvrD-helicase domain-containing protein [Echinicola jeungdonensis]MDN3668044.1 UvrD-helicase domain-containing protein [Echinicola jeungdonensis]